MATASLVLSDNSTLSKLDHKLLGLERGASFDGALTLGHLGAFPAQL